MNRATAIAGVFVIAAGMLAMAGWTGPGMSHLGVDAAITILSAAPYPIAWLLAAIGFGWPLRLWLAPKSSDPAAMQMALGVAVMLILSSALGRMGMLQFGGSVGAWAVVLIGIALVFEQLRRAGLTREVELPLPHWLLWTASPAIAVLLLAAASTPGWLWDTEFGGYDALSYHLQLPKEWLTIGAITPLTHNVYSHFPGAMEAAYYHLMILRGDELGAAYSCQLLHALFAVIAALVGAAAAGNYVRECAKPRAALARGVTFVVMLGVPWVVVVGSLAYDEMPMVLMLAAGLLALSGGEEGSWKRGAVVGLFAGVAVSGKLTAVGFVALPLAVLLLWKTLRCASRLNGACSIAAAALATTLAVSPYLIHNTITARNPVFPFATNVFGEAHWSDEQVADWRQAHQSDESITGRGGEAWHQLLRFGIGQPPADEERWHAQWSVLPWLTVAALIVLLLRAPMRKAGLMLLTVLLLQLLFWIGLTHIKSRFALPMAVPGSIAIGVAVASLLDRSVSRMWWPPALAAMLVIWSALPVVIYARQAGGAPSARLGMARITTGRDLPPTERERIARSNSPVIYMNELPEGSRVLFVGEAAPFYYEVPHTYHVVWDRGLFSQLLREHPADPAAWFSAMRIEGYTHLYVDAVMLRRWEEASWGDPLLSPDRVLGEARAHVRIEHEWPGDRVLFAIE